MSSRDGIYRTPLLQNRIPEPEPQTTPTGHGSALTAAHHDGRLVCRLAVDIGGTFTDAVLEDGEEDPRRLVVKVLTTPERPAEGFLAAASRVLQDAGRRPEQVRLVLHGTTLATNAILERKGARTAVLTTQGFKDVLDIGRGGRHDCYDLGAASTPPLVPRRLRYEVKQRHSACGREIEELDEDAVAKLAERLRSEKIESVAICFLHSHVNVKHEERAATILRTLLPGVSICTSCSVSPEAREYDRFSTAVANAYVRPLMSSYLAEVQRALAAAGYRCPLLLMTSSGGLVDADTAMKLPVRLVESGPAGGVALAENIARELKMKEVLALDMGGTTAKVSAVTAGRAVLAQEFEVDRAEGFRRHSGLPLRIPCVDLLEISGGGGSVAAANRLGALAVGPQSAGAMPGPACYGRGGTSATVTDADVILGRLDPHAFAAGEINLHPDLARKAMRETVTEPQGLAGDEQAACAVAEILEESVATAARAHAAEHGLDLGQQTLIAFGGAAPLHAAPLAERLGVQRVLVPPDASVGSAIGFLSAPLSFESVRSKTMPLDATFDAKAANAIFRSLWHDAVSVVASSAARWKPGRPAVERRRAYGRYQGQGRELAIELPNRDLEQADAELLSNSFAEAYQRLFSRPVPGVGVEILTWALEVVADSDPLSWPRERWLSGRQPQDTGEMVAPPLKRARTQLVWDAVANKAAEVPVYERQELPARGSFMGPAVVAEAYTSTVVTASFSCRVLENGFLQLERSKVSPTRGPSLAPQSLVWQLVWSRLLAAVEEQAQLLLRTAFAPTTREAKAAACGIFEGQGRLLSLSATGSPVFAGMLAVAMASLPKDNSGGQLEPGDVLLLGLPEADTASGQKEAQGLVVATPIFLGGSAPVGFAAGLRGSACSAFEVLTSAPVHLVRKGATCQPVVDRLRADLQGEVVGDLFALAAANDLAVRRAGEVLSEFGLTDFAFVTEQVCRASREAALAKVSALPTDGITATVDIQPVPGACSSTIACLSASLRCSESGRLSCLLTDADSTAPGIQAAKPSQIVEALARYALSCVLARDVPQNAGLLEAFEVFTTPELTSRLEGGNWARLVPDLIFDCLSKVLPEEVPASSGLVPYCFELQAEGKSAVHVEGGGGGGHTRRDGPSASVFPSGMHCVPVEVTEAEGPFFFARKELRCDSGGAGRSRGGLGLRLELRHAQDGELRVRANLGSLERQAPQGRAGGLPGSSAGLRLVGGEADVSGVEVVVPTGQSLVLETAGGGGLGAPKSRDHLIVLEDVKNGFVSPEAAMRDYGLPEALLKQ